MILLFGMLIGMIALGGIIWALAVAFDDSDDSVEATKLKPDPPFYRYDPL
ncbi:hypothetical protein [Bradyrhizobium prioriisuperbiae]|nr:hypothetical protein [Bradyrhizobium prioritasuperba]